MKSDIQNKHYKKEKLRNENLAIGKQLKREIGLFLFNALIYQIKIAFKSRSKEIRCLHEKKMTKFRKAQKSDNFTNKPRHNKIDKKYKIKNCI